MAEYCRGTLSSRPPEDLTALTSLASDCSAASRRAEAAEHDTAAFYRRMVDTLQDAGAKSMFERFLEIEQGHAAIVAAEIDSVTGLGFWFDTREFDLEAG